MIAVRPTAALQGPSPAAIRVRHLGVILRVHRRARYLRAISRQLRKISYGDGPRVSVLISADRPTREVLWACQNMTKHSGDDVEYTIMEAPGPIVSEKGLRWMTVLREQYRQLLNLYPTIDAASLWEDDAILTLDALREFRGYLRCLDADRVDARSLFAWDCVEHVNVAFPDHWSTTLFRVYPQDDFPVKFEVHCPEKVARSSCVAQMQHPWLNFGYMDPEEREETWETQKAAGKIDAHTVCLISRPELRTLPNGYIPRKSAIA